MIDINSFSKTNANSEICFSRPLGASCRLNEGHQGFKLRWFLVPLLLLLKANERTTTSRELYEAELVLLGSLGLMHMKSPSSRTPLVFGKLTE